jgi:hypothetical protein
LSFDWTEEVVEIDAVDLEEEEEKNYPYSYTMSFPKNSSQLEVAVTI